MRRLLAAAAAASLAACATGGKLRQNAAVLRAEVEKAKGSGAVRCAPRELALAEAHLVFSEEEVEYGHAGRAKEHLDLAERNVKDALRYSASCAPAQVTIAKKVEEPKRISIEKTDVDRDGVPDLDDACPELAGPKETQGCPVAKDTDADGVPDAADRCPLDPEDKDGFQDEDGCPDADNDGDGIVDRVDACPVEAGPIESRGCPVVDKDGDGVPDPTDRCPDVSGPKENQGCPDEDRDGDTVSDRLDRCPDQFGAPPVGCPKKYTLLVVKKERIDIKQQIHFAHAKYRLLPASFTLLDQVVQVLNDYPKMRVSVEGHTDSSGSDATNMRLSQRRAEAVRDYLVAKGVSPGRLEAVGYGPTKPIASNKTKRGKAQNRRTEFRIVSLE